MKCRGAYVVVAMLIAAIVAACANLGTPDGGPYDETPPQIVRTNPEYGATNVKAQKIVIEFDENIKIDNPAEKVVVSPPQIEQPDISASGKRITITLIDTVRPGITYTIDFADAIEDNNEGNPMGDYAFTFSSGDVIDTMQVSGYVLDASNLEPVKGMLVGLYAIDTLETEVPVDSAMMDDSVSMAHQTAAQTDTIFQTKPFERISRTDSRGHFIIKGLARRPYRVFALTDQDQTYTYSQRSEMLAFTDRIIIPDSRPDIRPDTVWHDSLHYDSIIMRGYTHFLPDDITLLAFTAKQTDRYFLKAERPNLRQFTLFFTNSSDRLPVIEGLNFDATDAFVVEPNLTNDTIKYWLRDSLVYYLDTLHIAMQFMGTDTLGQLVEQSDTLELISKISKAKYDKQKQQAYEDWVKDYRDQQKQARRRQKAESRRSRKGNDNELEAEEPDALTEEPLDTIELDPDYIPPMPEEFLELRITPTTLDPLKNVDIIFNEPIDVADLTKIKLREKVDSLLEEREFIIRQLQGTNNTYRLYAEWEPGANYELEIDSAAFVSIYGIRNDGTKRQITVRSEDSYGTVIINLHNAEPNAMVQLLNANDKVVQTVKAEDGRAEFYYLLPNTYYLRVYYDINGNGEWDTGDYDDRIQPEPVYYYPSSLGVKALWDLSQDWNPKARPLYEQKPEKITKQKPDKEKTIKNRNAEREQNKRK